MTPEEVSALVEAAIDGRWQQTNQHGVDLRTALLRPARLRVIDRQFERGQARDRLRDTWLVLQELPGRGGYLIVFDEVTEQFGLATSGFAGDPHPVLCGFHGDFWRAFEAM